MGDDLAEYEWERTQLQRGQAIVAVPAPSADVQAKVREIMAAHCQTSMHFYGEVDDEVVVVGPESGVLSLDEGETSPYKSSTSSAWPDVGIPRSVRPERRVFPLGPGIHGKADEGGQEEIEEAEEERGADSDFGGDAAALQR